MNRDKQLSLRSSLLWDTNQETLDYEKSADFVIGRVLDFGNLEEWKFARDFYGLAQIKKAALKHVFLDPRGANFWSLALDIPLKRLRCTRKLSLKTPKAFLMR